MRLAWIVVPLCLVGCAAPPHLATTPLNFGVFANVKPEPPTQGELDAAPKQSCADSSRVCHVEVTAVNVTPRVKDAGGNEYDCIVATVYPQTIVVNGGDIVRWRIAQASSEFRFPVSINNHQSGIVIVGNDPQHHFGDATDFNYRKGIWRLVHAQQQAVRYTYNIEVVKQPNVDTDLPVPCLTLDPIIINRP
jgi:hypothetical protein